MPPHSAYLLPVLTLLMTLYLLLPAGTMHAQSGWSLEFRPAVNFPAKKLGVVDLKTGAGFEGSIIYSFLPHLGVYAGWGWNKFSTAETTSFGNFDYEETGYSFGLRFHHPIGDSKLGYVLRGGGVYNHIETENEAGKIIDDTGHGLGWEAEGGLSLRLGERWRLNPGIRYRSLARDLLQNGARTKVDLNYFSAGVGIALHLK